MYRENYEQMDVKTLSDADCDWSRNSLPTALPVFDPVEATDVAPGPQPTMHIA